MNSLFKITGPLDFDQDRDIYVERPERQEIFREIRRPYVESYVALLGSRQMGKTTFIHSWILPLLAKTDPNRLTMLLCDGKNGTEFARYDKLSSCRVAISASDLLAMGGWLLDEINERASIHYRNPRFNSLVKSVGQNLCRNYHFKYGRLCFFEIQKKKYTFL